MFLENEKQLVNLRLVKKLAGENWAVFSCGCGRDFSNYYDVFISSIMPFVF